MIKQYFNLIIMLCSAWMVYSYCQQDTTLPFIAGIVIILSFLLRLRSSGRQYALWNRMPLSSVIIASLVFGWIWGDIFPSPESAGSPFPAMLAAVQSGSISASVLIFLRPFTKMNMYLITFCAWLNVATSTNVAFHGPMLMIFCVFCMTSTAIFILHTTKKPSQKKHIFKYYRDFILYSALLVMTTTGLFYGISKSIVLMDQVFMNYVNDYIMPRSYTHFLNINSRLYLGPPGRSAFDRRPVLEVTLPHVNTAYLKTQVFDRYEDGVWIEPEKIQKNFLPQDLDAHYPQADLTMFTSFENIIPSPFTVIAAHGNAAYTKSEDNIVYTGDEQRTRILKFSFTPQNPPIPLTGDEWRAYTRLPPSIALDLKYLSADIIGGEADPLKKVKRVEQFFKDNFKYSLDVNFLANDQGILAMIRGRRPAYCSYFASAMALLLRAQGLPSRVVAGFLITERIGRKKNTFLARVNNAHAWTEVLLPEIDPATGRTIYAWQTFDATPSELLAQAVAREKRLDLSRLVEGIHLALLRSNAYMENIDKNKLKIILLVALVVIMLIINSKKIFTGIINSVRWRRWAKPQTIEKPDKLRSIYRNYERYLKKVFDETRQWSDTDREVIERLRKRREIPDETIVKLENFLHQYHAARFGHKTSSHLKGMIQSLSINSIAVQ